MEKYKVTEVLVISDMFQFSLCIVLIYNTIEFSKKKKQGPLLIIAKEGK